MTLLDLVAKISLDSSEYDKGIDDTKSKASKIGGGIKTAMAAGVAAVGAASAAVSVLVKKSVSAYADYEQMVGGVRKLYGNMGMSLEEYAESNGKSIDEVRSEWKNLEKAQNDVLNNAKNAYKTTGMSANQYMEMATTFSASLINSLGGDTVKAAQQTDVAMRAISDNFNTFGGDIGLIQNAFTGFAKQNYSMLDNLKLGYGGTKKEMERLIEDANAYAEANGMAADLSIDSFSDIVTAIDLIQQKQNIAETTAREASTTIAGSFMMTKAAWENLLTGFADPDADISELMKNLVDSISIAASNLVPAIAQALEGIGTAFNEILPKLVESIPAAMETFGAPLLETGMKLVMNLIQGMASAAPNIISTATKLIGNLLVGLAKQLPNLITGGLQLITGLITGLTQGTASLTSKVSEIVQTLAQAFIEAAPAIGTAALELVQALTTALINTNWISVGVDVISGIGDGMIQAMPAIKTAVKSLAKTVVRQLGFTGAVAKVNSTFNSIKQSISEKINAAKNKVKTAITTIKGFFPLSIGRIFSGLKLPHFSVSGGQAPFGIGGKGSLPSFSVSWYKKAMQEPYVFDRATLFGAGESGDEMLYGHNALMNDIENAVGNRGGVQITNYITVEGAESPEDFANRLVRQMQLDARMAYG